MEVDVQNLIYMHDADNNKDKSDKNDENDNKDENDYCHYDSTDNLAAMGVCSWCANEETQDSQLFICDDCPRVFCKRCLTLAHGGSGTVGLNAVNQLECDTLPWSCIYCRPTHVLIKLQSWMNDQQQPQEQLSEEEFDGDDAVNVMEEDESSDQNVQELLDQLGDAEDMKDQAESMLEIESEKRKWNEIKDEMQQQHIDLDQDEINHRVQEEFDSWKQLWSDHHTRSSDAVGVLMDALGKFRVCKKEKRPFLSL